jgi:hypothetical protein
MCYKICKQKLTDLSNNACLRAEISVEQLTGVRNIDDVSAAVVWDVRGLEGAVAVLDNLHVSWAAIRTLKVKTHKKGKLTCDLNFDKQS